LICSLGANRGVDAGAVAMCSSSCRRCSCAKNGCDQTEPGTEPWRMKRPAAAARLRRPGGDRRDDSRWRWKDRRRQRQSRRFTFASPSLGGDALAFACFFLLAEVFFCSFLVQEGESRSVLARSPPRARCFR
jgi:hypothetical protein